MLVYAIDPGTEQSALVTFDGAQVLAHMTLPNPAINDFLRQRTPREIGDTLAVEQIASFGMPVGEEVFTTVWWSGRFAETWLREAREFAAFGQVKRTAVKMHLCGNTRAKDPNIRQALLDRFGPGKDRAIGRKATPGPLYGLSGDEWSALAVAVTWWDQMVAPTRSRKVAACG